MPKTGKKWTPEQRKRFMETMRRKKGQTQPGDRPSFAEDAINAVNDFNQRWSGDRYRVCHFLNERTKIYNSTMEAYVDGYLEGFSDANSTKR